MASDLIEKDERYGLKGKPIPPNVPAVKEPLPDIEKTDSFEENRVQVVGQKKGSGCMKGCMIVFLVLLFLGLLIAGAVYFGYRKISEAMEPVDLGVEYTQQDYIDIMEELGVDIDGSLLCIDCPTPFFSDPNEVEVTVSNAQASAAFEYINQYVSGAQISGTQIRMGNGQAQLSTSLEFQGRTFPVHMIGTISKAGERSLDGEITSIKVGGLSIPDSVISYVESFLLDTANEKLASAGDTVRIDSIEITSSGLNFKGLVPTKAQ